MYASNFNSFGKMYRVMVQAAPDATKNMETLQSIKVRNGNEMAPITQFISITKVYGPDVISRFNLYTSMKAVSYTHLDVYKRQAEDLKELKETFHLFCFDILGLQEDNASNEEREAAFGKVCLLYTSRCV